MNQNLPAEIVAAVDLGSNSFHMIVARLNDGHLHMIDRMKEPVRLASGLDKHRRLNSDAQAKAIACLERFGQRLSNIPSANVRAVGTNTLRSAAHSKKFLSQATKALGHPIEIISGIEEARLIYAGVAQSLATDEHRRLVIDVGGGSTEFIIGCGNQPLKKASLQIGCVAISNKYFKEGKITRKRMKRALIAIQQELEYIRGNFSSKSWHSAVGASGTIRAIAKAVEHFGWSKDMITLDSLDKLVEKLIDAQHVDHLEIADFNSDRLAVFPGGIAIVFAAFRELKIEAMRISDGALREGALQDLIGRIHDEDIRDISVKQLAERYQVNFLQTDRIVQTLQYCMAQINLPGKCDYDTAMRWLKWAAYLHEIGFDIAHNKYHKHGAYIIEHADIGGFSRQEQKLLATLVSLHRRKFVNKLFTELVPPWDTDAKPLAILLRFAVVLHRSRHPDTLENFKIEMGRRHLFVRFPDGWLANHPLTEADLSQEAKYLKSADIKLSFR